MCCIILSRGGRHYAGPGGRGTSEHAQDGDGSGQDEGGPAENAFGAIPAGDENDERPEGRSSSNGTLRL